MPACYNYSCLNVGSGCSGIAGWASATGATMAMFGYSNIHYDERCCDDACFQTCASMCGTPPGDVPFSEVDAIEKTTSESIYGLTSEQAKIIGGRLATKAIKEDGVMKNVFLSSAGILTLTYLVKR